MRNAPIGTLIEILLNSVDVPYNERLLYTLLIIPDAWRQLVNWYLFLFKTKPKASLYFTNWRHISGIINKVYTPVLYKAISELSVLYVL